MPQFLAFIRGQVAWLRLDSPRVVIPSCGIPRLAFEATDCAGFIPSSGVSFL
jgi:hypothetical protein